MRTLSDAPIACHVIDTTGVIKFANAAECRLLGLAPTEIVGRPVWEFVAAEEREKSRAAVQLKLTGQQSLSPFERHYERPDGQRLVLEIHEAYLYGNNGKIAGIHSFLLDITPRKRAEQALQESETRYRHLVESASDIIYRADLSGRFIVFNSVATKLLGYKPQELTGLRYLDLIREDYRREAQTFYRRQLLERVPNTYFEFPVVANDGRILWFGQNVALIEEGGRPKAFEAVARDITQQLEAKDIQARAREELEQRVRERTTELEVANEFLRREMEERRQAEQERRKLEEKVQHAQRLESLGVLAGGIAHDFNNLLASIMGHASIAAGEIPEGTHARTCLEEVVRASRAAAELTQQMLAYSGRGQFLIESVNLSRLVEELVRLMGTMISKKARLRLDLAPSLPPVRADTAQMRQIIINLVTNASDALPNGSGDIAIATGSADVQPGQITGFDPASTLAPGQYVYVEVRDTGCGMDQETRSRIFDPFFTTKFTGRGLGLAAVLGIVRAHSGAIEVESEPGRGTRFRILLPATADAPVAEEAPQAPVASDSMWKAEGLVLVVDDERAVRQLAAEILTGAGFRVVTAADGDEALSRFVEHAEEMRAVVLDLTMPGMDGIEVYRRISSVRPDAKVIVCSGYNIQDVDSRLGADSRVAFLRKPYLPAQLLAQLRAVMEF